MNDGPTRRCFHEGITLVRLPLVDARGEHERNALHRAWTEAAWRASRERLRLAPTQAPSLRNVLRFGGASKA